MKLPRLLIAGTHSGVGKTTVALTLLAGFRRQGRQVQPFKVGPDFIDPGHHQVACGRTSHNLDGWILTADSNQRIFRNAAQDANLSIIEGMMGLFDGSSPINEIGSSAEMAKLLKAPVLLVVDGSGMARSVAAMVFGFSNFDPDITIAGVVFNRIRSERHYQLLREAVELGTNVSVVGYIPSDSTLSIPDRHLGLRTALEGEGVGWYTRLVQATSNTLDLSRVERLAQGACDWEEQVVPGGAEVSELFEEEPCRIAVAYDPAFCFYYAENIALLEKAGGSVFRFSPMNDAKLPDEVDLLYLGGGYPEVYAARLAQNTTMRNSIAEFVRQGGVVYAECGGLLYLSKRLQDFDGKIYEMVGVIPSDVVMNRTQMTLGYREITLTKNGVLGEKGMRIRGHEFHYSCLENSTNVNYEGKLSDAQGNHCRSDGIRVKNVLALYTHLHFASYPHVSVALMRTAYDKHVRRRKALHG